MRLRSVLLLLAVAAAPLAACKQGEGGICQVNDDCNDGLTCNAGTRRCQEPSAIRIDGGGPPDANPANARTPDAGDDEPDAGEPDAGDKK
jgi:hypothetical protein